MPQEDNRTAKMEKTKEVFSMILPANYESAKVVQPGKQALDLPSFAVAAQGPAVIEAGTGAPAAMRSNQQHFILEELLAQRIAVVSPIRDEPPRQFIDQALLEGRAHQLHFGGRSSLAVDGDRKTMRVSNGHDFAALAPLGLANPVAPFLAAVKLPSMKHSDKSSPPRSWRSRARPPSTARSTPALHQF